MSKAHSEAVTVRRYWGEVMDDLEKEYQEQIRRLESEIERLKKQNLQLTRQRDEAKDKLRERTGQYYAAASELEEERGKNRNLTAQVNRDFENSSLPSSLQRAGRKPIPNSRKKTGRRPGGQPGHKGHSLRKYVPDISYKIPSPAENAALYIGREKKGHAGVSGAPLQDYAGTVVHDHDKTFYSYGTGLFHVRPESGVGVKSNDFLSSCIFYKVSNLLQ